VFHTKNNLWLANLTIFSRNGKFLIEKIKTNGKGKGLSFEFSILFKPWKRGEIKTLY